MKSNFFKIEILLSFGFFVVISLPLTSMVFSGSFIESFLSEDESIFNKAGSFKYTFSENYDTRQHLIEIAGLIKSNLYNTSTSSKVIMGEDSWLFLSSEQVLDSYRNIYNFNTDEKETWENVLLQREKFSQEHNAEYYFLISPDKHKIYSSYLPKKYQDKVNSLSRYDEMVKLTESININLIDPRNLLKQKHTDSILYYKTDTHWNELGAYYAYTELISTIIEDYPEISAPVTVSNISISNTHGGDLARMSGLDRLSGDTLITPHYVKHATFENGDPINLQMIDVQHTGIIKTICPTAKIGKAVIFHDSFGVALIPYLAEHFKEAYFFRSNNYITDAIVQHNPDVIIQQIVERRLLNWKPDEQEISGNNR